VPKPLDLRREYAEYHAAYSLKDHVLIGERRLTIAKSEVSLAELDDLPRVREGDPPTTTGPGLKLQSNNRRRHGSGGREPEANHGSTRQCRSFNSATWPPRRTTYFGCSKIDSIVPPSVIPA